MTDHTYSYSDFYRCGTRPESVGVAIAGLLAMIACIINCALPQLEMLFLGGRVPIPIAMIKIASFGVLVGLTLLYGRLDLSAFPTILWLVAVGFLLLDFGFLWFWQGKAPIEIFLGYNAYYCPLILAPFACAVRGKVPERLALRIILLIFAVCALVGWSQFLFQLPIVQTASNDGNFRIYTSFWMQEGSSTVRAFSIFGTALEYGNFAVVVAGIGIGMCGKPGGWVTGLPLYLFAAACCYTTLTRVVFLQLAFATIAAAIFTFGRSLHRMIWQPLSALGLSWLIAFSGISELVGQTKTLYDASSLQVRLLQWEVYGGEFLHSTFLQKMLGLGFCQADKPVLVPKRDDFFGKASTVLVDNFYLALTLHIGVIGLLVMLGLFWAMWRFLRRETIKHPSPLLIGIASFWSTFLLTGMFNVEPALYGFWFLIATMFFLPVYSQWEEPVGAAA
jgi:hypothetical protein